jgi:hypothetical protein
VIKADDKSWYTTAWLHRWRLQNLVTRVIPSEGRLSHMRSESRDIRARRWKRQAIESWPILSGDGEQTDTFCQKGETLLVRLPALFLRFLVPSCSHSIKRGLDTCKVDRKLLRPVIPTC